MWVSHDGYTVFIGYRQTPWWGALPASAERRRLYRNANREHDRRGQLPKFGYLVSERLLRLHP